MPIGDGPCLLAIMALGLATDAIYVWTTRSIANNKALQAACGNGLLTMIGLSSTWIVISNQSILDALVYCASCFLGTYLTMKFSERKQ